VKIIFVTPNATDVLSFYRGIGPLRRMRQQFEGFDFVRAETVTWATVCEGDMVFLQRPFNKEHMQVIEICKKWNVPVIGDFDDWLGALAPSNPAYSIYTQNKENFFAILKSLDGALVSTEHLKTLSVAHGCNNVVVAPNAYDTKLFPYSSKFIERQKIVAWRGGNSHMEDLLHVKEDFDQLIAENPDWVFLFIAQSPYFLKQAPNLKYSEGLDVMNYFSALYNAAPAILTHPLVDSDFNRSKSMCSWLEATHAWSAFVGNDFEEFQRPGITHFGKTQSFYDAVSSLIKDPDKIGENISLSKKYVQENLTLEKVNQIRYKFFNKFL
jgi:glycosyltransferase involved in cell wall biosynthesis